MRRRVILLVASFLVLLAAFGIYLALAGGGRSGQADRRALRELSDLSRQAPGKDGQAAEGWKGTEFRISDRDKDGRLKASYFAPEWRRQDDGGYLMTNPKAVLYQPGGQQIHISGQRGVVYVSSDEAYRQDQLASSKFRIRKGRLEGKVIVLYDRATAADRSDMDQRPQDVVRITTEDIDVDNEEMMLSTNGRVMVASTEADISGQGLSVRWNEDPQELRMLRLERGDYMKVYNVSAEEGLLPLPGGAGVVARGEGPPDARQAASEPTSAPPVRPGGAVRAASAAAAGGPVAASATRAVGLPASAAASDRRRAQNIYRATFRDDVTVDQGARRIRGADALSLDFQWERSSQDAIGPNRQRPAAGTVSSRPAPAAPVAPSSQPTGRAIASRPVDTAATKPASGEPILVKWNGPLVISPLGYTDVPSRKNVGVSGQGRQVVLSDSQATAHCQSFTFRRPGNAGELSGSRDEPVVLTTAKGENVVCPVVRFDLLAGTAELAGGGYMTAPAAGGPIASKVPPPQTLPTTQPVDRIRWSQSVQIKLASGTTNRGAASQYIREATFRGDVELVQAANGDSLRCDELTAWLGQSGARQSIERAVAQGGVQAAGKQDGQDWLAKADRLDADPNARTAILYGKPASIGRGQEYVSGNEIHLAEQEGTAQVVGGGRMMLYADSDLSGQKLKSPRPVDVSWARQMFYSDHQHQATFDGLVVLVSGPERMECDKQMRVLFQTASATQPSKGEVQPARAEADKPAGGVEKPRGMMTLGARSYGGRLSRIYADDDVILTSLRQDPNGRLLGRTELKGKSLTYDAVGKRMDIGKGTLFAQDFRPPKGPKADSPTDQSAGGEVESPSQTYFEWARSMRLVLDQRMVTMVGDVWMRHYSGDKIVNRAALERDLKLPPWPARLPAGRATDLLCDNLVARFAEPAAKQQATKQPASATAPATQPGEDMDTALRLAGALDVFIATGSVFLADGMYEVTGERLSYDRSTDIVLVRGYLEGQAPAFATVTTKGQAAGSKGGQATLSTTESEWIKWYRRTNAWETGRISGAGAVVGPAK